jgi:hypothetical protein
MGLKIPIISTLIDLRETYMKYYIAMLLLLLVSPLASYAADGHESAGKTEVHGVEGLSKDLRALLSKEMIALEKGMKSIITAYVSGKWDEIEVIADKMENSYILRQSLTKQQMHELHSVLPAAFIEQDQQFHYLAGMLGHAAKMKKVELINFYYSEMTQSCVACHSEFAIHKFPALSSEHKVEHQH